MTNPPIKKYPLDPTGKHPDNFVDSEIIKLNNKGFRVYTPIHYPFYLYNFKLIDVSNGKELIRFDDYNFIEPLDKAVNKLGHAAYCQIGIHNKNVSNDLIVSYQVVGGEYEHYDVQITTLINAALNPDRKVFWKDILDKPQYYRPSLHFHDIGDLYGFEYVVEALISIRDAILTKQLAGYSLLLDYIDAKMKELNITKESIGLGNVENYGIATEQDVIDVVNNKYTTPLSIRQYVEQVLKKEDDPFDQYLKKTDFNATVKPFIDSAVNLPTILYIGGA